MKLVIFLLLLVLLTPGITFAQPTFKYEDINPTDGFYLYTFKRLQENFKLKLFSFSKSQKAQIYEELMDKRLAEIKYMVDKKDLRFFEKASQRYFSVTGAYTQFLIVNNLTEKSASVQEKLNQQKLIIKDLMNSFEYESAQWMLLKHNLDYLDLYVSQLPK